MLGLGLGELLLIIFIIFMISPRDIPKVMKKLGQFWGELTRLKRELMKVEKDVYDVVKDPELEKELKAGLDQPSRKRKIAPKKRTIRKKV